MNDPKKGLEWEFEVYAATITIQETFREIYEIMAVDFGTLARNITNVIDATKKIADIALSIKNVELQESILELRTQLVEIKGSLLEAKEENLELRQENKALKELEANTNTITLRDGYYYTSTSNEPVCGACFDAQKKTIRLVALEAAFKEVLGKNYKCPICKTLY
jgi:hypothetical protein